MAGLAYRGLTFIPSCGIIRIMDMQQQQIRNHMTSLERHQPAYRFQMDNSEWCEISFNFEREDGKQWELVELFVSSHNYESNQMTLQALDHRLSSIIVSRTSSQKAWDMAKMRAANIFNYLQGILANYGIEFVFGQIPS